MKKRDDYHPCYLISVFSTDSQYDVDHTQILTFSYEIGKSFNSCFHSYVKAMYYY